MRSLKLTGLKGMSGSLLGEQRFIKPRERGEIKVPQKERRKTPAKDEGAEPTMNVPSTLAVEFVVLGKAVCEKGEAIRLDPWRPRRRLCEQRELIMCP